jgi:transposase InsO family protein
MTDPGEWRNKYKSAHGSLSAEAKWAGQIWHMDATPADVMTKEPGQEKGRRCCIGAAIDIYSRRAVCVVSESAKAETVAAAMRKGMMAWGIPKKIFKDNGKDYQSYHVVGITEGFRIQCPKLPAYMAEAKGNIERFFGTLTRALEERLPLFTGHTVEERSALRNQQHWARLIMGKKDNPADPMDPVQIPLSQAELQQAIDEWISNVYENEPHDGFMFDYDKSKKGLTPLEAFMASPQRAEIVADERALDIALLKSVPRIVSKKGIRINNGIYNAPELVWLVGESVIVKVDPDDAGRVIVYKRDGQTRKHIFCCIALDPALQGKPPAEYFAEKARIVKRHNQIRKGLRAISENMDQPYEYNTATNKVTSVDPQASAETKGIVDFTPAPVFTSDDFEAAVEARAALDGEALPETKVIDYVPDVIFPTSQAEEEVDEWAKWPIHYVHAVDRDFKIFEWYLDKEKAVGSLTEQDKEHMNYIYENSGAVQLIYNKDGSHIDSGVNL